MPEANPFQKAFNPDYPGSLTGFLGGLMGNPTTQERVGAIKGRAMETLARIKEQGNDPQKSMMEFVKTPEGQDLFVNDPQGLKSAAEFLSTITPPAPTIHNVPPGNIQTQTTQGGVTTPTGVAAPTTEKQNFDAMAQIAQLPPEKLQEYAAANMMIGGRYQVHALKNWAGDETGQFMVFDKLTGTVIGQSSAQPRDPANILPPGTVTPSGEPDYKKLTEGKAGMFLGTGLWPSVLGTANSVIGSVIDPSVGFDEGRKANLRADQMQQFMLSLTSFPETVGKSNQVIKQMQARAKSGWGTDPVDALGNAIQTHDMVKNQIFADENIIKDVNQSKKEKEHAANRVNGWKNVLSTLPERGEMVALRQGIIDGKVAGVGVGSAIQTGKNVIEGVGGAVEKQRAIASGKAPAGGAGPDIINMPVSALAKLDPSTLSMQQKQQLKQRLDKLGVRAKAAPQEVPF